MNNEILNEKLNQLLSSLTIENIPTKDIIQTVKTIFPKNDFTYENINNSTDFYVENKDIIRLSPNNETKIVISYPEGDRFGDRLSDPNTDIWIEYLNKDHLEKLFLLKNNHTEERWLDTINDKIQDLIKENELNKSYVLNYIKESLNKYPPVLPNELLERTDDKILLDNEVKTAVINGMKDIAEYDAGEKYDQSLYGSAGGMDVEYWEMQECEQFRHIHLPDNVEKLYKQDIEDMYLQYEGVYDRLKDELESLKTEMIDQTYLYNNKELILSFFSKRNEVYKNNKEYIKQCRDKSPEFDEIDSPVKEFIKTIILPKENIEEEIMRFEFQKNKYNTNKLILTTFSSELNDDELYIKPQELEDKIKETKELDLSYHDKYDELSTNNFKPWQFIQRRRNEIELFDTIGKINHIKNLLIYLDTKLENQNLESSMNDLEITIDLGNKYNNDIEKLYSEFDEASIKKIITAISADKDLSENLALNPQNYQKILDDHMYDLNLLNERFENTKNQLDRADEIFSTKEADLLLSKENSNELSYDENEEQEDEGLEL